MRLSHTFIGTAVPGLKYRIHVLLLVLLTASCSSIPPLDPTIGDTGQPQSDIALKTDVLQYTINIEVLPKSKSIQGSGSATFYMLADSPSVELKLDSRFDIERVEVDEQVATYTRQQGIILIALGKTARIGDHVTATVYYSGKPHIALKAPWEGGFVWDKTATGEDFIATAVQGEGCDLFWPCKDHFNDKAERTFINLTVPKPLVAVTNGVLQQTVAVEGNKTRYEWLLSVPASDYNIALNIAPYKRIETEYTSVNGVSVPIEFWALPDNAGKASTMIESDLRSQIAYFEDRLGPYPWGQEKLGFVETPHLGMEHQTINAYGKEYARDENGFDWLLHHELAHEWFGNLMTHKNLNDVWLHEGFGLYMQPDYSLYKYGQAAYNYRMYKSYLGLLNCEPVVREGQLTSDQAFNADIYGKGGWILHTLRWLMGESAFWQATRELVYGTGDTTNLQYPIKPRYRTTQDFIDIVNRISARDYTWLFDVYLKQAELPNLQTVRTDKQLTLTWQTANDLPFPMPVPVSIDDQLIMVDMASGIGEIAIERGTKFTIDPEMKILRYLPMIGLCKENQQKRDNR